MPTTNKTHPQIKISRIAHRHISEVVQTMKQLGFTDASIASEASRAILEIPMPKMNGNGHRPQVTVKEEGQE